MERFKLIAVQTSPSFDIFMVFRKMMERREYSVQSFGVRQSKRGVPILFGLGFKVAELIVMEKLKIDEDILHLVNRDELERHFGVREGVVMMRERMVGCSW
ncbi:hypothetical protein TorRG33x02_208480 [Trema orientale]|uniref:Uncharacterized protein n=1 Tax=Trema orientale TaxID=63057 RepID=A0A2P5ED20_TREOI|nr:hypothetical protein TorRG33x02_208480 [Trema orientale]